MTYWSVNFIFLGISAVMLLVAVLVRRPRGLFWGSLVASFVLLGVLTAIFDNLMIAAGIMTYTEHNISGVQIGLAPLEDFAYPFAGVLLLPALWLLLGGVRQERGAREERRAGDGRGAREGRGAHDGRGARGARTPGAEERGVRAE